MFWSLTAIKANSRTNGKLFILFFTSVFHSHFISLNSEGRIFLAQKQHTCLQKLFFTSKNSCKECFVEQKQIKSTTATSSKLRMFGTKTCHFCSQLEHVFSSHVLAYMTVIHSDKKNTLYHQNTQPPWIHIYKLPYSPVVMKMFRDHSRSLRIQKVSDEVLHFKGKAQSKTEKVPKSGSWSLIPQSFQVYLQVVF